MFSPSTANGGAFSMAEFITRPSCGSPLNRHPGGNESFYVLTGQFEFIVNGEPQVLKPGGFIRVPDGAHPRHRPPLRHRVRAETLKSIRGIRDQSALSLHLNLEGRHMSKIPLAVLACFLLSGAAHAGQTHIIGGLFCNTRAEVEETLALVGQKLTISVAVEITNRTGVACVHATRLRFMVTGPVIIGRTAKSGTPLDLYEATLVGVLVGGEPRPIEPALPIFFVTTDHLPDAAVKTGI